MEGYVTVLAEMENAATLPVLMHSGSTMSDGPSDPRGSRWQGCFTVRICSSVCRPECVCAAVFVRLGTGGVCPYGLVETHLNYSGLVPNVIDIGLCVTVFTLTSSQPCVCFLKWAYLGHVIYVWSYDYMVRFFILQPEWVGVD